MEVLSERRDEMRLNKSQRETLCDLATRIVDVPAETKAEEATYQKAAPLVRALVEAEFPPSEMKLLLKYECARRDRCINVQGESGGVEQFVFRSTDPKEDYETEGEEGNPEHPLVPDRRGGSCRNRIYIATAKAHSAVSAWIKSRDAKKKALKEKLDKYHTFINVAANWEQVLEIWPEASQVADSITRNLPAAINDEVIAEIKADSTRRTRALAKAA